MKIEIMNWMGVYWWVSKETNDAAGKEFSTKEDAIADAKNRLGNIAIINQEVINDKRKFA